MLNKYPQFIVCTSRKIYQLSIVPDHIHRATRKCAKNILSHKKIASKFFTNHERFNITRSHTTLIFVIVGAKAMRKKIISRPD